jgi:hypothetical protein
MYKCLCQDRHRAQEACASVTRGTVRGDLRYLNFTIRLQRRITANRFSCHNRSRCRFSSCTKAQSNSPQSFSTSCRCSCRFPRQISHRSILVDVRHHGAYCISLISCVIAKACRSCTRASPTTSIHQAFSKGHQVPTSGTFSSL